MKQNVRLLLAMLFMLAQPARAFIIPSFPIELSKADRQLLEQLACIKPHGVTAAQIDASTFEEGNPRLAHAHVECKPHSSFRQKPMHYTASCEAIAGGWNCGKGNLRIVVPVSDAEIIVSPGGYEPAFAYDTISKVARAGTFQGYALAEIVKSACSLSQGKASEWIDIQCGDGMVVTVSTWCPQSECPRIASISLILY